MSLQPANRRLLTEAAITEPGPLFDALASGGGGATDPEVVRDTMAAALVAGSGVTITPNDGADTITIAATGGGGALDYVALGRTSSQSIATAAEVTVNWDSEEEDASGYHDNVTNPSRMTVPTGRAGLFLVSAAIQLSGTGIGAWELQVTKNGTATKVVQAGFPAGAGSGTAVTSVRLAAGDYVQIVLYVASGTTVAVKSSGPPSKVSMTRLGS